MEEKFPDASVLTTVAGGVACAPYMEEIVTDGLMLVGDAAASNKSNFRRWNCAGNDGSQNCGGELLRKLLKKTM